MPRLKEKPLCVQNGNFVRSSFTCHVSPTPIGEGCQKKQHNWADLLGFKFIPSNAQSELPGNPTGTFPDEFVIQYERWGFFSYHFLSSHIFLAPSLSLDDLVSYFLSHLQCFDILIFHQFLLLERVKQTTCGICKCFFLKDVLTFLTSFPSSPISPTTDSNPLA